eukprot:scaffold6352_cov200-Isochrysis_galbana.AAC.8
MNSDLIVTTHLYGGGRRERLQQLGARGHIYSMPGVVHPINGRSVELEAAVGVRSCLLLAAACRSHSHSRQRRQGGSRLALGSRSRSIPCD